MLFPAPLSCRAVRLRFPPAGVMAHPKKLLTKDGFEMQVGTNHIGHQYLTQLLLPKLKQVGRGAAAAGARKRGLKGEREIAVMVEKSSFHCLRCLQSPASRVVSVSSMGHKAGGLSLEDPNFEHRRYNAWLAYGQSKLANILMAKELARR